MARTPLHRRLGGALAAAALTGLLALVPVLSITSATAHSGPMALTLNQDGTGRIMSTATYVEDGHPVTSIIDPTLTAQSPNGDFVGPIALVSAPEGEGMWITEDAVLPAGEWTVTVTVTTPEPVEVTQTLDVVIVDQTPVAATTSDDPKAGYLFAGAAIAAVIAIGLIIALIVLRRRQDNRNPQKPSVAHRS